MTSWLRALRDLPSAVKRQAGQLSIARGAPSTLRNRGRLPKQPSHQRCRAGRLRGARTNKVHIFMGERLQVDKPKGAPAWLPGKI